MKNKIAASALLLTLLTLPNTLRAADGTWINLAGGSWPTSANWSGGVVADGIGSTADFTTLTLGADTTVNLDGPRTNGILAFGDAGGAYNWTLAAGSGGPLTLKTSSGSPVLSNSVAKLVTIGVELAGTQGFVRDAGSGGNGNQVLITSSNPGLSGPVMLGAAQQLTAITAPLSLGTGPIIFGTAVNDAQKWLVAAGGDITLTNDIEMRGIRIIVGNQTVGGFTPGNQTWNGNVLLNHGNANVHDFLAQKNLTINGAITEATAGLQFRVNSGTVTVNGPIQVTGGVKMDAGTVALNGAFTGAGGVNMVSGSLTMTGTNTYTGGTTLLNGNLFLGNPTSNAIPAGAIGLQGSARIFLSNNNQIDDSDVITFNYTGATANNARVDLTGFNETVAGIQNTNITGAQIVEAATDSVLNAPATLTLNVPAGQSYKHVSYVRNGTGAGSILSLVKTGLGQQTFSAGSGVVGYTGLTTINAGILEISGASSVLANSPVNLAGGTLLFSGASGTGLRAQSITNDLSVAGTLHKTGGMALQLGAATVNVFTGSTIVDGGILQVQAGGILASNVAVVNNGGTLEILGLLQAPSTTVNSGGTLVSGSGSAPTAEVAGPVTNNGGIIRGWAILDNVTLQSGTINPALGTQAATLTISNLTCQGGTLQFDLASSDTTTGSGVNDLLQVDTLNASAPTMIDLPAVSTLTGARYVIMTYNTLSGSPANLYLNPAMVGIPSLPSLDTSVPGQIAVVIGNPGAATTSLTWTGGLGGHAWDVNTTTNWVDGGFNPAKYFNSDAVTFDDSSTNNLVNLATAVYPGAVTFNNSTTNYVVSGAGRIITTAGLTKSGSGSLTLNVPATIGTTLQLGAGSPVVMAGGSNYLNGTFAMDTSLTGSTFILTNGAYLNAPVNGGSFNVQAGNNLLVVAGAGSVLNVNGATVGQIGIGSSTGATGNRVILRDGGAWTNIPNNLLLGGTSASDNHLIITNGGRFVWSPTGAGNVLLGHGSGAFNNSLEVLGASSVLDINGRTLYCGRQGNNNVTTINSGVATNLGGVLINDLGDGTGNGLQVLNGGRLYSSGAINLGPNAHSIVGAFLTVDNGSVAAASASIGGNAAATGSTLTLTNGGSLTLTGNLTVNNASSVVNFSSGTLSVSNATVNNGLVFTVGNGVNAATLALNGGNATFANDLVVSANAQLKGNGSVGLGNVTVNGTLSPGASLGALTFSNTLTLAGNTVMELNKSQSPSNDVVTVIGTLNYGGTLTVTNLGAAPLVAGDTFKLFSAGSPSGSFSGPLNVISPANSSVSASFNAASGVLTIDSATAGTASNPTNISYTLSGNQLTLTWPGDHLGWYAQSNSVNLADAASWHDVPNSQLATNLVITISPAQPKVFYRLRH